MDSETPPRSGYNVSNSKSSLAVPTAGRRMDVTLHTSHERYPTSLADRDVLYNGNERPEQVCDKLHASNFDDSAESSV